MSYHNASAPLADCTAQAMQDANQSHTIRKAQAHAHSQAPAVVLPKKGSFSHDPYVSVIPSSVDEMMRIMESRRHAQVTMRRTYSSPNFFNSQLNQSTPQSPLQGAGTAGNSPISFPRVGSAPMFFEEPDMSRTNSPLMANFGESVTSFGDSASFSSYPSPNQVAPSAQQSRKKNKKNKQQQQQQQLPLEVNGPSERRQQQQVNASLELPVPASVARQQALQQQQGANDKARSPTTQQPATSSANSSTDSAGVMTKVYQNGRPMPRMVEEPVVERPKVVAQACQKNVAVTVKFRYNQSTFRASRMDLLSGDYVVVDGDRGMDLGQVIETADIDTPNAENTVGAIQRPATEDEVEKWKSLAADEAKALDFARVQASRHLNSKLTVEHVNFQFDRQKLTLWYKAPERVYFVPLLKALNQEYKCRIWMERIGGDEDQTDAASPLVSKKNEKKEESKKE